MGERKPDSQTQRRRRIPDRETGRDTVQAHRNQKKGRETERWAEVTFTGRKESGKLGVTGSDFLESRGYFPGQ